MHLLTLIFHGTSVFKEEEEMLHDGFLELGFCFLLRLFTFPLTVLTVCRLAL